MKADIQAARIYGEAFFLLAQEKGLDLGALREALRGLRRSFAESPEVVSFLQAPNIPAHEKEAYIRKVTTILDRPLLGNFLLLLLRRGRMELLEPAMRELQLMTEKALGIARGHVTTAKPLSDDEKQRLTKSLEAYTNSTLSVTWAVVPELIGGVVFKSGDILIDSSLRSQLVRLRTALMAPRVY
jgi:F-type H+-transporting ATPase subunit delta